MELDRQALYPLELSLYRLRKPWGGWPGRIGEVWSLSGPPHESLVLNGPLTGRRLTDLVGEYQEALLGEGMELDLRESFPFRLKFISTTEDLPIRVGPDDAYTMREALPSVGQEKLWFVLKAESNGSIYLGFREDTDEVAVREALGRGALLDRMNAVRVRPGDLYTVPAGRIHGLGRGVVLFELGRHSGSGFRVLNRDRGSGEDRSAARHIEEALKVADYRGLDPRPVRKITRSQGENRIEYLALTPRFVCRRLVIREALEIPFRGCRFVVYTGLRGSGWLRWGLSQQYVRLQPYQSVLVPGVAEDLYFQTRGGVELLETSVTDMAGETLRHLLDLGVPARRIVQLGGEDYGPILGQCLP